LPGFRGSAMVMEAKFASQHISPLEKAISEMPHTRYQIIEVAVPLPVDRTFHYSP